MTRELRITEPPKMYKNILVRWRGHVISECYVPWWLKYELCIICRHSFKRSKLLKRDRKSFNFYFSHQCLPGLLNRQKLFFAMKEWHDGLIIKVVSILIKGIDVNKLRKNAKKETFLSFNKPNSFLEWKYCFMTEHRRPNIIIFRE